VLLVAACGGSGAAAGQPAGTGTNASDPQALAASECMRANGIKNFPDPDFGPRGGIKTAASAAINVNAPAFIRANQECNNVGVPLPGGG
jgi:hypothetical protein